jgi:hypothetical protein
VLQMLTVAHRSFERSAARMARRIFAGLGFLGAECASTAPGATATPSANIVVANATRTSVTISTS